MSSEAQAFYRPAKPSPPRRAVDWTTVAITTLASIAGGILTGAVFLFQAGHSTGVAQQQLHENGHAIVALEQRVQKSEEAQRIYATKNDLDLVRNEVREEFDQVRGQIQHVEDLLLERKH